MSRSTGAAAAAGGTAPGASGSCAACLLQGQETRCSRSTEGRSKEQNRTNSARFLHAGFLRLPHSTGETTGEYIPNWIQTLPNQHQRVIMFSVVVTERPQPNGSCATGPTAMEKYTTCRNITYRLYPGNVGTAELREHSHSLVRYTLKYQLNAGQAFFAGRAGYPKWKSRHGTPSSEIPDNARITDGRLAIPKVGWLRVRRRGGNPYEDCEPLKAVVKRAAGRWYATDCYKVAVATSRDDGSAFGVQRGSPGLRDARAAPTPKRQQALPSIPGRTHPVVCSPSGCSGTSIGTEPLAVCFSLCGMRRGASRSGCLRAVGYSVRTSSAALRAPAVRGLLRALPWTGAETTLQRKLNPLPQLRWVFRRRGSQIASGMPRIAHVRETGRR